MKIRQSLLAAGTLAACAHSPRTALDSIAAHGSNATESIHATRELINTEQWLHAPPILHVIDMDLGKQTDFTYKALDSHTKKYQLILTGAIGEHLAQGCYFRIEELDQNGESIRIVEDHKKGFERTVGIGVKPGLKWVEGIYGPKKIFNIEYEHLRLDYEAQKELEKICLDLYSLVQGNNEAHPLVTDGNGDLMN